MEQLEKIILGNPKDNSWNFVKRVFEEIKKIEEKRGNKNFVLEQVNVSEFPDGEFEPQISCNCRERKVVYIADSSKYPAKWLMDLMLVNDAVRRGGASQIINVLPYMRWSRGEKKDKPRIPVSTKVIADCLGKTNNCTRADSIVTLDIHADAIPGMFDCITDSLRSYQTITDYIKKNYSEIINNLMIVAPDNGSSDRVRAFANKLKGNLEIAIIDKKRKSGTLTEVYNIVGDVEGKDCILVDDILSSGGTLRKGADALRKNGAKKIYGYVTHFVGSGNYKENIRGFEKFWTTDSFYHNQEELCGAEIISLDNLFAEAIYRRLSGESISELFK